MLVVDSTVSDEIRNLASDVGVDIEPRGSAVLDYTDYVLLKDSIDPTLIVSDVVLESPAVFGPKKIQVSTVATRQKPQLARLDLWELAGFTTLQLVFYVYKAARRYNSVRLPHGSVTSLFIAQDPILFRGIGATFSADNEQAGLPTAATDATS